MSGEFCGVFVVSGDDLRRAEGLIKTLWLFLVPYEWGRFCSVGW